ncbi:VOC family protein [Actinomadura verrucosospora]|uniref:Glyoxalase/bleomycin resistance protein/dioxygenase n=1 Tax=Actinomadura verrucosospora TaxID=46165 RepID=A0A7D3VYN9_ACTVE|nr:VOC family protein [Actinomadura verrucosospora]QKG24274.1 Glyoxalase/bleomycin resistance protein/dioxygenase [Actinomadura verrucosospora]
MTTIPTAAVKATTLGLNHVNLVVADVPESVRFYTQALGMQIKQVTNEITFLTTPGAHDVLALQAAGGELDRASGKTRRPGDSGGVDHIGFDVADAAALQAVIDAAQDTGGTLPMQFAGADGLPTAFIGDPDGYVLQLSPRRPTDGD